MTSRFRRLVLAIAALLASVTALKAAPPSAAGNLCGTGECVALCHSIEYGHALCIAYCDGGQYRCEVGNPYVCLGQMQQWCT